MVFGGNEFARRFIAGLGLTGVVKIHGHDRNSLRVENRRVDAHPIHQGFTGLVMKGNARFLDLSAWSLADNQDLSFFMNLKNRPNASFRIVFISFIATQLVDNILSVHNASPPFLKKGRNR